MHIKAAGYTLLIQNAMTEELAGYFAKFDHTTIRHHGLRAMIVAI
jgi:hypothetical protein